MKKLLFPLMLAATVALSAQQTMLPDELKPFVLEYFEGQSVRSIAPKADNPKLKEVIMEDMSSILYDGKKNIVSVTFEGESRALQSFLPNAINDYLAENYPENRVAGFYKEKKREKVVLDNGKTLYFSPKEHTFIE